MSEYNDGFDSGWTAGIEHERKRVLKELKEVKFNDGDYGEKDIVMYDEAVRIVNDKNIKCPLCKETEFVKTPKGLECDNCGTIQPTA